MTDSVSGAITLKKMSVAGTGRAGPYSFFGPNGDGNHGSSSSLGLTGGWIAGLLFMVTEDNYELSGYSQWCCDSAQAASTIKFALWQATGGSTGTLVASSEATLGTQTPGAWASVSLGTPIALTKNQVYKVVAGTTSNLPWDNGEFSTAGQYVNGSVNGPLTLFSSDSGDGGTNYDTYGDGQASYQWTNPGPTDPTSQYPGSLFGASNPWTDVIVQLPVTGNPAITGTIKLKKMVLSASVLKDASYLLLDMPVYAGELSPDSSSYTLGVQFKSSEPATLTAINFYSAIGAGAIPFSIDLFAVSDGSLVHSEVASWSGEAGSGWIRAEFSSPPSLEPGVDYKASVTTPSGAPWYSFTSDYWTTGPGASGIVNGPLSAPNNDDAAEGQDSYAVISGYPNQTYQGDNYWVNPEVVVGSPGAIVSGALSLKKMVLSEAPPAESYSVFQTRDMSYGQQSADNSGTFDLGLQFTITESGYQLSGYYWYLTINSGTDGTTYSFDLFTTTDGTTGTLVSGSEVTGSGTWTVDAWNYTELETPVLLDADTTYVMRGENSNTSNARYQFITDYWGDGWPGADGVINGPISVPSGASALNGVQQPYSNPSQSTMPVTGYIDSWYGVDIAVTPVSAPPSISGAISLKKMVLSAEGDAVSEIVVVQEASNASDFPSPITAHNSILFWTTSYGNDGQTSPPPTVDGSVYAGTVKLWEGQSVYDTNSLYMGLFLIPDVTEATPTLAQAGVTNATGTLGWHAWELQGAASVLDAVVTVMVRENTADTGEISIGPSGETSFAHELVFLLYAQEFNGPPPPPVPDWSTNQANVSGYYYSAWKDSGASAGVTFSADMGAGSDGWVGVILAIPRASDVAPASISGAISLKKMVLSASVTDSAGISFDSINYAGAFLGSSCEVTIPDGINDDDLLLLYVNAVTNDSDGDSAVLSISSTGTDWTQPDDSTVISSGTSSGFWAIGGFFYCGAASTSDAGKVVTVSSTVDLYWELTIAVYSRAEVEAFQGAAITGAATVTSPELTSSHDGDWVLYFGGTTDATDSGAHVTYPSGTLRGGQSSGAGVAGALVDSDGSVGNAGTSVGDDAWTDTDGGSVWNTAFTVILSQPSSGVSVSGAISLKKMVLSGSHENAVITGAIKLKKMVVAASGAPSLTVAFQSTSGGVDTYTTVSPVNGASATMHMRVLAPVSPNPSYPHAFLWLLPVEGDQGTGYGDSIQTVKDLSANDNYNLTCIQPGFYNSPWYGDNVDDPTLQDETFLMQLVAWADAHLSTTGTEKHYLIGFSKSGFGGQAMFWRHQPKFSAVASWDAACDLQLMTDYGGDPDSSFGEQSQLDQSVLYDPNLATWKAEGDTATVNRIYLAAGINLITPTSDYSDRLTADGILHSYTFVEADSHQWAPTPGWVGPALAAIIPPSANTVTVAISLKKMVLSGTSHEKTVISGTVKLKKMVISGASHEKAVITGTITLKKMRVHGEEAKRKASTLFVFWPL